MAGKKADPFENWRQWLDRSERQINTMLNEFTSSPKFGKAQARMMESLLKTQQGMNHAAERYFSTINIPTRTDILELGGRLSEIEERLVNIESVLLSLAGKKHTATPQRSRPARTRKPPATKTVKEEPVKNAVAKKAAAKPAGAKKATKKKRATKKSAAHKKSARKGATQKKATQGKTARKSAAKKRAVDTPVKKTRARRKTAVKPAKKRSNK